MTRRLRMAGVGLSAFLLPACMSTGDQQAATPYLTGNGQGYVHIDRSSANPAPTSRIPAADQAASENAGVAQNQLAAGAPPAPPKLDPTPGMLNLADDMPMPPPPGAVQAAKCERPDKSAAKKAARTTGPMLVQPAVATAAASVIASPWPVLGVSGAASPAATMPNLLPPVETENSSAQPMPGPPDQPTQSESPLVPEPPKPSVSLKVQESPAVASTVQSTAETILLQAIRAFQNNRPREAVEVLKHLDATNQELLMYLMPLVIRLSEGNADPLPPEELAMLIDRLQTASSMLQSKASLRADRVCLCRDVRKFADLDLFEPGHVFRPGEMVFLYAELKNFTCEAVAQGPQGYNAPTRGFRVRLETTLEIHDSRSKVVWHTDLAKTDFHQTPPLDVYHTYRFCIPDHLPAGTYTLWLHIVDKPSGRAIRKPVELRVGQS